MSAYRWTNKMPAPPTKASGLDSISTSDSKRQIERLRADNAELTKSVISLQEQLREAISAIKSIQDKPSKKKESSAAQE